VTRGEIERPIHPIGVVGSGLEPAYKYVPKMEALVGGWIEPDHLKGRWRVMRREQQ
jgi:hypothetical protein